MEDYGCRIRQRRGPGKRWREQEEEVFVRQTKPDHTLGASIAISILSGGWALGGFIDVEEGRDEYGSGRLAEKPSLCRLRALGKSMALALSAPCDQQPRLDNG